MATGLRFREVLELPLDSLDRVRGDLTVIGNPTSVAYYLTDTEPTGVADLTPLEEVTLDRARVRTSLDEPASGRYLVVWLTELPAVDGGFRGEIAEIVVSE